MKLAYEFLNTAKNWSCIHDYETLTQIPDTTLTQTRIIVICKK
jgi:hypothetical protein